MGQSIRDIMTSNPSTVEPNKTVVEAARIMKQEDAGVVPVTENGRLTGMVTDRDIAIRVVAEGMEKVRAARSGTRRKATRRKKSTTSRARSTGTRRKTTRRKKSTAAKSTG